MLIGWKNLAIKIFINGIKIITGKKCETLKYLYQYWKTSVMQAINKRCIRQIFSRYEKRTFHTIYFVCCTKPICLFLLQKIKERSFLCKNNMLMTQFMRKFCKNKYK